MRKTVRWAAPVLLVLLLVGCTQQSGAAATVTVSTTVTVTQTQTQMQAVTLAGSAVIPTETPAPVSGSTGRTLTFDSAKVAAGVRKILTDAPPNGYGLTGVTDTSCPNRQPVKTGTVFLCHATINNASKAIQITVKDDAGMYEVGVPN
jgi:hypothetical protein